MFITHFGRHNKLIGKKNINISINIPIKYYYENLANYYSYYCTYLFILCFPKNTLICKLDTVYRYIVYNGKFMESLCLSLWKDSFMAILHTFCIKKNIVS